MKVKLNEQGLVPAIAQDINTNQVLMLGYMNPGSIKRTVEGVQVWFYSRSREDLWHKGEVSGNYLNLKEAWLDCDGDTLLLKVDPDGPACHTGETSCFFNPLEGLPEGYEDTDTGPGILAELFALVQDRQREMPEGSYTVKLLEEGVPRIAQKVIEEAGETAIAAVQGDKEHDSFGNRRPPLSRLSLDGGVRGEARRGLGRAQRTPEVVILPAPPPSESGTPGSGRPVRQDLRRIQRAHAHQGHYRAQRSSERTPSPTPSCVPTPSRDRHPRGSRLTRRRGQCAGGTHTPG